MILYQVLIITTCPKERCPCAEPPCPSSYHICIFFGDNDLKY